MNFYKRKENIIKIQSVWRGYFLRKIAVGSIKKYIGFIALIKYMEKIFSNNIEYLFYEFIFLLRKYPNLKTVYKKINNKKNKLKNTRKRNKTQFDDNMVDVTDDNNNNYRINELKTNLFQSEDFNNYKLTKDISVDNANYPKERYQKYTPNKLRKIGDNISAYTHNERQKDKSISRYDSMYKNENNSQNHYFLYRKKLNNYSELSNDVINSPQNIVYIPKKVCGNKGFRNKNLIKENENKKKIENFIKIIKYYCYYKYYPYILYKLKILQKLKIITHKLNTLYNVIELIEKKKLKQYLKKYRDIILTIKVNEDIFKKQRIFPAIINNSKNKFSNKNNNDNNNINDIKKKTFIKKTISVKMRKFNTDNKFIKDNKNPKLNKMIHHKDNNKKPNLELNITTNNEKILDNINNNIKNDNKNDVIDIKKDININNDINEVNKNEEIKNDNNFDNKNNKSADINQDIINETIEDNNNDTNVNENNYIDKDTNNDKNVNDNNCIDKDIKKDVKLDDDNKKDIIINNMNDNNEEKMKEENKDNENQ